MGDDTSAAVQPLRTSVSELLGDQTVVTVGGDVDVLSVARLRPVLLGAIEAAGAHDSQLVIDLGGVSYLDSSGLGLLVQTYKHARNAHVTMSLRLPPERTNIRKLLTVTGLDRIIPLTST